MDNQSERDRRHSENTDKLYFCLIGLGLSSVGVMWTIIVNQLIGG